MIPRGKSTSSGKTSRSHEACAFSSVWTRPSSTPVSTMPVVAGEGAGIFRIPFEGRTVHFIDAFSANDVESTRIIQERALAQNACPRPWIALFNNRADRPLRMKSFADDLLAEITV